MGRFGSFGNLCRSFVTKYLFGYRYVVKVQQKLTLNFFTNQKLRPSVVLARLITQRPHFDQQIYGEDSCGEKRKIYFLRVAKEICLWRRWKEMGSLILADQSKRIYDFRLILTCRTLSCGKVLAMEIGVIFRLTKPKVCRFGLQRAHLDV